MQWLDEDFLLNCLLLQGQAVQDQDNKGKGILMRKNNGHHSPDDRRYESSAPPAVTTPNLIQTQVFNNATLSTCKVAKSNYLLCHVSPSEWNKLTAAGQIFVKLYIGRVGITVCQENWSVIKNVQKSTAGGIFNRQFLAAHLLFVVAMSMFFTLHCNFQEWPPSTCTAACRASGHDNALHKIIPWHLAIHTCMCPCGSMC